MNFLNQKIESLPAHPGVYLFRDKKGTVLYVGKAGNIKHRVSSYFQRAGEKDAKTLALLEKVADIETILTDTEKEALILEDNLIKEHHPRYNIKLRDDKRYPCLRLSVEEDFPTLSIVRRIKKDRSIYFGPYPSATSLKETLKLIRRLFPIRTCLHTKFSNRTRPCINYEMERCSGPCCGKIDPAQYGEIIRQVKMFLEGRNKDLLEDLKRKMERESEELHFEVAARVRDQIRHIEHVIEKQKIVSRDFLDQDVIGFHRHDHTIVIHPLFVRGGKLLGGRGFTFPGAALPDEEVLSSFIRQYYHEGKFIPEQVLIPKPIPEQNFMEERLTGLRGKKVNLLVPRKGEKKKLLQLACENAERHQITKAEIEMDQERLLETLKDQLRLAKIPRRIEVFDISNLHGGYAVGAMVAFEDGKPNKDRYRHFKIKTVEGADDYGMMYEVLLRQYQKAIEENDLPDMVLLDGGKGQLNVAQEVFKELQIKGVDLISFAKGKTGVSGESSLLEKAEEKVFRPQVKEPFRFMKNSPVIHLLDRIRDEAHRFAITYHKKVRKKGTIRSVLEDIPGIGRTRQKELLKCFGSVDRLEKASLEELINAPKMTFKSAQSVYDFFHS
ncbi:MAG: excinuclease ABC subunit UvrC, partial [Deltaproteobacteria bacterium]|nr:excinuclease ABC subunit UvrC [Deltaproteobacteria bacterium]